VSSGVHNKKKQPSKSCYAVIYKFMLTYLGKRKYTLLAKSQALPQTTHLPKAISAIVVEKRDIGSRSVLRMMIPIMRISLVSSVRPVFLDRF